MKLLLKRLIIFFLTATISGGVLMVVYFVAFGRDQLLHLISVAMDSDSTRRAPFFSEIAFKTIQRGTAAEEVLKLIGPPLWASSDCGGPSNVQFLKRETCDGIDLSQLKCSDESELILTYSYHDDPNKNFWITNVVISHGKVVSAERRYIFEHLPCLTGCRKSAA